MNELFKRLCVFVGLYFVLGSLSYMTVAVFNENSSVSHWNDTEKGFLGFLFLVLFLISILVAGPLLTYNKE